MSRPPELFVHLRDDLFAMIDPLDDRMVIVDGTGRVRGASAPLPFVPASVVETPAALEFVDKASGQRIVVPRTVDPAGIGTLTAQPPEPQPAGVRRPERRAGLIAVPFGDRGEAVARALAGGRLTNATLLGVDSEKRIYVQTSELIRSAPVIEVKAFVQRFSPQGRLLDAAIIPLAAMDSVPNRTVALNPSGEVSALVPTADRLFLQTLSFVPVSRGKLGPQPAAPPRRTPIDATVEQSSREPLPESPVAAAPLPPTTRAAILSRANDYLAVNWTMRPENFSRAGIDNACVKTQHKFWQRPHRFNAASVGKTFAAMPYHWGGDDTPDSFRTKLADGHLAGSVCTCRDPQFNQCVVGFATGVDCSGFVSRSWGIAKRGTTGLGQVAKPIAFNQLRPGDALNRAGHHVRLFVGFKPGADVVANVLELATNLACEGVCQSSYTVDQLNGYKPLRFSGVTN